MDKFNDIINIFINNGMAVGIVIYFLYRDNKYNTDMILLLNSIKEIVERLEVILNEDK